MRIEILIKESRKDKKKTLNEISKSSGISVTHINDIENNLKSPSLFVMVKIAHALNVDIKELYKIIW